MGGVMAVIWQRKKNLIVSMVLGAVIAAIPLGLIIGIETISYRDCKKQVEQLSKEQKGQYKIKAYAVNCSKQKGDLISEKDLIEYEICSSNSLNGLISKSELVGKELKVDVEEGTILDKNLVYESNKIPNDMRVHMFSDIDLHSEIFEGSIVDIRIVFPNGEDYLIAEHKKVIKRIEDSILINVNEEEILKLASAKVDRNIYEGAKIYAIMYVKDYQEAAKSNYPVNRSVIELGSWDPNLINKIFDEETAGKRNVLETNMNEFVS